MESQKVSSKKRVKKYPSLLSLMGFLSLFCALVFFASLYSPSVPPTFASDDCSDVNDDHEDDDDHSVCLDPCEDSDHNGEDDDDHSECGCADVNDDHEDDDDHSECDWGGGPTIERTSPKVNLRNFQLKN